MHLLKYISFLLLLFACTFLISGARNIRPQNWNQRTKSKICTGKNKRTTKNKRDEAKKNTHAIGRLLFHTFLSDQPDPKTLPIAQVQPQKLYEISTMFPKPFMNCTALIWMHQNKQQTEKQLLWWGSCCFKFAPIAIFPAGIRTIDTNDK